MKGRTIKVRMPATVFQQLERMARRERRPVPAMAASLIDEATTAAAMLQAAVRSRKSRA